MTAKHSPPTHPPFSAPFRQPRHRHLLVLWILGLLLLTPTFAAGQVKGGLSGLNGASLRGCFAITKDGTKMACFNKTRGEYSVEIKGTFDRRLYKAWPIAGNPEGAGKTSILTKILGDLTKRGFHPLTVGAQESTGDYSLPGYTCTIGMTTDTRYIKTIAGDAGGPWIDAGGIGGQNRLAGVSLDLDRARIILVVDQRDASGETELREFKIFPLTELQNRAECVVAAPPQPTVP